MGRAGRGGSRPCAFDRLLGAAVWRDLPNASCLELPRSGSPVASVRGHVREALLSLPVPAEATPGAAAGHGVASRKAAVHRVLAALHMIDAEIPFKSGERACEMCQAFHRGRPDFPKACMPIEPLKDLTQKIPPKSRCLAKDVKND